MGRCVQTFDWYCGYTGMLYGMLYDRENFLRQCILYPSPGDPKRCTCLFLPCSSTAQLIQMMNSSPSFDELYQVSSAKAKTKMHFLTDTNILLTIIIILTSNSSRASIWLCRVGIPFNSFSTGIVLITPSALRERERERERETDRQTDRQTDRERERES